MQMKKQTNPSHLQIFEEKNSVVKFSITDFILHQLIFLTLLLYIVFLLELSVHLFIPIIVTELIICYLHWNTLMATYRSSIQYIFILLYFLIGILLYRYLINGFVILYNEIAFKISTFTGKNLQTLTVGVSGKEAVFAEQLSFTYLLILLLFLTYFIVKLRSLTMLIGLSALIVLIELFFQRNYSSLELWVYFVVALLIYVLFFIRQYFDIRTFMTILVSYVLFVSLFFMFFLFIYPADDYAKHNIADRLENYLIEKWNDFRYEKNKVVNMPQGNFYQVENFQPTEETALEIVMSKPTPLYLRGFVGAIYRSNHWEELTADHYLDNYDMLYWLQEEGYHPLTQLTSLYAILEDEIDVNKVSINNVGANSKYIYTPYELIDFPNNEIQMLMELEQSILGDSFFGERSYRYSTSENLVLQYPTLANMLYKNHDNEKIETYLTYESYYNNFVYDTYLQIPDNINLLLKNHLGTVEFEEEEEHVPYEWAINKITTYLEENIQYDEDIKVQTNKEDFLMKFLENERKGYAPHFATAATVMFRYFGIPARYVEGYLASPEKIEEIEPYEKVNIQGTDAHAWTEIYIDEIGWIPIETTPGYEDAMGEIDISNYPSGPGEADIDDIYEEPDDSFNEAQKEIEDETEIEDINNEPKEKLAWYIWLFIAISFILFVLIIMYVIFIIRKRKQLKQLIQSFDKDMVEQATINVFSYILSLYMYDDIQFSGGSLQNYIEKIEKVYGKSYRQSFEQAWKYYQLALYSKEPLTESDRQTMLQFYNESIEIIIASKGFWKKIKIKWIDVKIL